MQNSVAAMKVSPAPVELDGQCMEEFPNSSFLLDGRSSFWEKGWRLSDVICIKLGLERGSALTSPGAVKASSVVLLVSAIWDHEQLR